MYTTFIIINENKLILLMWNKFQKFQFNFNIFGHNFYASDF